MPNSKEQRQQLSMVFRTWGGKRRGAGRRAADGRAGVSHRERAEHESAHPVHVTLKVRRDVPGLRAQRSMKALRGAFGAGRARRGFRLVHFSVQHDHVHMIVEAADKGALSRGVQGLNIRVARALNREFGRRGRVLADRFHARALTSPREVKNALAYVLLNARHHRAAEIERLTGLDPCSSADVFDGWRAGAFKGGDSAACVMAARTWLLAKGWRRHGLISPVDVPGAR